MKFPRDTADNAIEGLRYHWKRAFVIVVVVVLLPAFTTPLTAGEILVLSVFAFGFNFMFGFGGEISFGHAAYYGLGAYGTIVAAANLTSSLYVAVVIGILVAAATGLIFGWVSLHRRGVYFAMITLALAQMVYFLALSQTDISGGTNGRFLTGIDGAIGPFDPFGGGADFYYLGLVVLFGLGLAIRRVLRSPFGTALIAVRENETRAQHLGYDSDRILLITFVVSAAISGIAGALYVTLFEFVSPDILFWSSSGTIILITILGGSGTLAGPVIGSVIYVMMEEQLSAFTNHWALFFGATFVLVVLVAPEGIYPFYQGRVRPYLEDIQSRLRE